MRRAIFRIFLPVLLLTLLFIAPQAAMDGVRSGAMLWADSVLPALLPFYVATHLLQQCGGLDLISPLMRPFCRLLHLPDKFGGLLFAGWLSGTPNGARLLSQVCEEESICTRLCACFTLTSPMFLIGTTGQLLGSTALGALVYGIHLFAAICTGLLWRNYGSSQLSLSTAAASCTSESALSALPEALRSSSLSMLFIGGTIVFFSALTSILKQLGLIGALESILHSILPQDAVSALVAGFFEVTQGAVLAARGRISLPLRLSLLCAFAAFGGISTLCQAKVFLQNRVRASVYFLQRLTHAVFSFFLCRAVCLFFDGALPVSLPPIAAPVYVPSAALRLIPALCILFSLFPRKRKGR